MLTSQQLQDILRLVTNLGIKPDTLARLRAIYPGVHFTHCLDDEIGAAEPVLTNAYCHLYLVSGGWHCLSLTSDLAAASGVVLAEVVDESVSF
jgi:hypothetical protein